MIVPLGAFRKEHASRYRLEGGQVSWCASYLCEALPKFMTPKAQLPTTDA